MATSTNPPVTRSLLTTYPKTNVFRKVIGEVRVYDDGTEVLVKSDQLAAEKHQADLKKAIADAETKGFNTGFQQALMAAIIIEPNIPELAKQAAADAHEEIKRGQGLIADGNESLATGDQMIKHGHKVLEAARVFGIKN